MNMILRCLILIAPLLLVTGHTASASEITFLTHGVEGATFLDDNGLLRGKYKNGKRAFTIELVLKMMSMLNHPPLFEIVPFKRGFMYVQKKPDYALFNVSRKPDREKMVQWVGPLLDEVTFLYELADTPTPVLSRDDARKVDKICVRMGTADYEVLVEENFKNIYQNSIGANCFKMLVIGRVNLVSSDKHSLNNKLKQAGIPEDKIRQTPVIVHKSQGYIAFSNNIPKAVIAQWQNALDSLKQSGEYVQLVEKYLLTE
ncbi:hypothetical protein DSCA_05580 [Desulfosarcina alkanivorans]|uniref:Uncharacterized protein n=1 Tax=Desulfosarcina alkanivorans TaxID=571177 RepID=A0A5K7YBU6_9BACT|nr:ABC transporter substrate-binding protein [Desulfosarcina alkanivorans]BBO66628.1 hypothetical protein DSCA_05580 [Desulfosarcina alkanivorans]